MKISKVNHSKTAVGTYTVENNNHNNGNKKNDTKRIITKQGGFLYKDPSNNVENTERWLKKRNSDAQRMYNVFNMIQAGTVPKKPEKEKNYDEEKYNNAIDRYNTKKKNYDRREKFSPLVPSVNSRFKNCIFRKAENNAYVINDNFDQIIEKIKVSEKFNYDSSEFVILCIRKSLKKEKDGAIAILNNLGKRDITEKDKGKIKAFIDLLKKDYNKVYNNRNSYEKAIANQNLVIQPKESQFEISKPDANGKRTSHKNEEKNGLVQFMDKYSVLDIEMRMECLRKVRRILDLYFSAPSDYKREI